MTFTPGPWHVRPHFTGQVDIVTIEAVDESIAYMYEPLGETYTIEANAHLIAATPDLLAACEAQEEADRLEAIYYGSDTDDEEQVMAEYNAWEAAAQRAIRLRRDAIAKARGHA